LNDLVAHDPEQERLAMHRLAELLRSRHRRALIALIVQPMPGQLPLINVALANAPASALRAAAAELIRRAALQEQPKQVDSEPQPRRWWIENDD
jgi:hypothetical protein